MNFCSFGLVYLRQKQAGINNVDDKILISMNRIGFSISIALTYGFPSVEKPYLSTLSRGR